MTSNYEPSNNFTAAFVAARTAFRHGRFCAEDRKLVDALATVVADGGPHSTAASSLETLRKLLQHAGSDECTKLVSVAGAALDAHGLSVESQIVDKVAALKLLRHLYLAQLKAGQQLWIVSLPCSYRAWPHKELRSGYASASALQAKTNDVQERFSSTDRRNLGVAAQDALKWALDAQAKIGRVAADGAKASSSGAELVQRWFCDENSTESDIKYIAGQLHAGFQKIASAANSGRLIFTDHVGYRGKFPEQSEAFVLGDPYRDNLHVIYIESAFFGTRNTLTGPLNWARIIVHELSHREINTTDVPHHYAWEGIKPSASAFPAAQALKNAENWAFFAADCAGLLTADKRAEVLR
ncbi:MAG: hypothetical protein RL701_624 [Pseudomonadota bacterium]